MSKTTEKEILENNFISIRTFSTLIDDAIAYLRGNEGILNDKPFKRDRPRLLLKLFTEELLLPLLRDENDRRSSKREVLALLVSADLLPPVLALSRNSETPERGKERGVRVSNKCVVQSFTTTQHYSYYYFYYYY